MNQQPIKIAVFGLGGVGGYYGAMLALRAAATDGLLEVSWIALTRFPCSSYLCHG